MDPTDLSDAQLDQLADQLAGRLPSGTHGDRVVLSRRAFAAAVGGTLGASGLVALGVDPATAQSAAGQVGTQSSPVDVFAFNLDVQGALQRDLDAGGQAIENAGSVSTGGATVDIFGESLVDQSGDSVSASFDWGDYRIINVLVERDAGGAAVPVSLTLDDLGDSWTITQRDQSGAYSSSSGDCQLHTDLRGGHGLWHIANPGGSTSIFGNSAADNGSGLVSGTHPDQSTGQTQITISSAFSIGVLIFGVPE